ncbi:MAG: GHKL domain-containing protein [Deltaproteobacteria bacterium]|nr:GHKL domain-containing protein [Deltaproteobacteria bacterium]
MKKKESIIKIPTWILIGAFLVMLPIFGFITVGNIWVQKQNSEKLLLEKGAALIRSFEAGTRTGMMGTFWNNHQLQRLLTETAKQPDIEYLLVSDFNGKILSHSNKERIGETHDHHSGLNPNIVNYRIVESENNKKIFEVYRKFLPSNHHFKGKGHGRGMGLGRGQMRRRMMYQCFGENIGKNINLNSNDYTIFVGLNMSSATEAGSANTKQAIIIGIILLLVGISGILLLFVMQNYRNTKASLTKMKAYSDTIVNNMPIGLLYIDDEKNIVASNQMAESLFSLGDIKDLNEDVNILPTEINQLIKRLDSEGEKILDSEIVCNINEIIIPLEVSVASLMQENEKNHGYILLIKDLREIDKLRKEIELSKRLASVGSLAAGVAHEIRNPLSSVKGFATYFMEKYKDIPEDKETARIMIQETERLNRVVGQLLEFAKPVSIEKKNINIKGFTEDSLKLIEMQAAAKNIGISFNVKSEMQNVMIDTDRMSQVYLNIFINSIESMEENGQLSVDLIEKSSKKGVVIKIRDTGCGIKEKDLSHIFDPYYTTKSSGTGIGLAIVHNIIESHDGEITYISNENEGTTVSIYLPYGNL